MWLETVPQQDMQLGKRYIIVISNYNKLRCPSGQEKAEPELMLVMEIGILYNKKLS